MSAPDVGPVTKFGRLERRGILLGLSAIQLGVVGTAVAIAVAAVYAAGMAGLVAVSPVWGVLVVAGVGRLGDRSIVAWIPLLGQWHARHLFAATTAAQSTARPATTESVALPGLPGRLDLLDCAALGGAIAVDRRAGSVTGVLRVAGSGFILDDPSAQEHKVASWERVLAGICQQPAILRVQVLIRTRPGGLAPARRWWREHRVNPPDGVAAALANMLDESFVVPHVRETFVAVAVRAPRGRRRMTEADVALVAKHLDAFGAAAASSGLVVDGWLDARELLATAAAGYDPAAAGHQDAPLSLPTAVGVKETWRHLRTGGSLHATFWICEWPRAEVHAGFLQPLVLGEATDRTLTLIAEPLPTARALRDIRRAKVEHAADAAQRARSGQIENESTRAELADLERREAELVAGHGDLRFTGLVTVSAEDEATLEQRCAALESASAQGMCEVRRLVGQQGVAHAAACLPLARGVL